MKSSIAISNKHIFFVLSIYSLVGLIPLVPTTFYYSKAIIIPIFSGFLFLNKRRAQISGGLITLIAILFISYILSTLLSGIGINLIALLLELVPLLIFLSYLLLKLDPENVEKILMNIHVISSLFGVIQFIFLPQYEISLGGVWYEVTSELPLLMKRPGSIFGNSNVFGAFNLLILVLLLFKHPIKRDSIKFKTYQILVLLNIILIAKSRSSLISAYLIYLVFFWNQHKYLILGVLLLIPIFILSIFNIILSTEELNQIFRLSDLFLSERNSFTIRKEIFEYSFQFIKNNLFLGVGPGNILTFFQSQNAPHNGPETAGMWIIIEKGILSYLCYIIFLVRLLFNKNLFKKMIGVSLLVIGVFETVMIQSQILGIILILSTLKNRENVI